MTGETPVLETVQIVVDGSPMNMLVATPAGEARAPGVLLSHYQHGLGPFTRRNAERLASEGFVVVAPDLVVTKDDGVLSATDGDQLDYTITVTNVGRQTATGVAATDTLPAGTTFVSCTASCRASARTSASRASRAAAAASGPHCPCPP